LAARRLALILGIAAFAALGVLFPGLVVLLTDWWWFREIGYQIVFTQVLTTRLLLFLGAGGITFVVLYLNLRIAQRGLVANPILLQLAQSAPRLNLTVALRRLSLPLALGLGLLAGLGATAAWGLVLQAIYGTQFGIADPAFSRDIGFYVFRLPALSAAIGFLFTLTGLSFALVVAVYWVRGDLVPGPRRLQIEPSAGLHLAILLAVLLLLTALRLWTVDIPSLL